MNDRFQWVAFYQELAGKLLDYQNRRPELVEKVKTIFEMTGINMPTLEKDNRLVDIDPFTVFGLFNKSSMRAASRIKIIDAVKKLFQVAEVVPETFNSIPVLNNLNATFYTFIDERGERDIDDLWGLYHAALSYANAPNADNLRKISEYFDLAIHKKFNGNAKITMGLFWIAPHVFLNLDSRNEWYIYQSGKIPSDIVATLPQIEPKISAKAYFEIAEKIRAYLQSGRSKLKNYMELSYAAWVDSTEVNSQQRSVNEPNGSVQKGSGFADDDVTTIRYWIYAPGEKSEKWDDFYRLGVMGIGWHEIGDLKQYHSKDEMKNAMQAKINSSVSHRNNAHATWQFAHDMKPGDIIFVKKGPYQIIGRGVVLSDYYYDPETDEHYPNLRKVNWTNKGEWQHPLHRAVIKTLTDLTFYTDYVNALNALFESEDETNDTLEIEDKFPQYTPEQFLNDVYMDAESYDTLVDLLHVKNNVILQGPPGVGKTYVAKRLAYSMMGVKDQNRVMMVQFHQSYTYEDFIEGFRPSSDSAGFEIKKGSFYNFCKKAADDLEHEYFFIIDEINRGNLSRIFGELFVLIEKDKRGNELQLLYSDDRFSVPANVYILGMMNTADRSLALLDYALRRRFAFFEMKPGFDQKGFTAYRQGLNSFRFDNLIACVKSLNNAIAEDETLGEGFLIGHSYFCNLRDANEIELRRIVEYELIPLLKEYWFDEPSLVKNWVDQLRSSIQ